jgi:hypothetical protein
MGILFGARLNSSKVPLSLPVDPPEVFAAIKYCLLVLQRITKAILSGPCPVSKAPVQTLVGTALLSAI